ncbi:PREDICTED: nuclear inhibitor of protein phosphatase 1-like [Priapulus caudatus]|uniref:Nuclear inhibitor of protein phosphatase 1-like n=1 Tax=Priapulus caudatus TaxID=37621 RepID=A0ABM1E3M0_PRICU|nr:PREDICTED: nuclear inhibitor of protein phosphatase 1-like [Priapulus caudatus]
MAGRDRSCERYYSMAAKEVQQTPAVVKPAPYDPPSWAGKSLVGLHLDVMKDGKMIQKLMIDEKRYYLFGRNKDVVDFVTDHGSCSRVHAVLLWHKHLNRTFLLDLGSTHGSFLGSIRLESHKPQQVPIDSTIRFGASTRTYIIRERPNNLGKSITDDTGEEVEGGLLGLPETETELENLTEFNTAHNRRVTTFGIQDTENEGARPLKRKRSNSHVNFSPEDEIINPEDIDPSVGRFRNMIQTAFIPKKKMRQEGQTPGSTETSSRHLQPHYHDNLYSDLPHPNEGAAPIASALPGKLGFSLPNPAPELETMDAHVPTIHPAVVLPSMVAASGGEDEPKKKKYAKEAWPGKRPTPALLL